MTAGTQKTASSQGADRYEVLCRLAIGGMAELFLTRVKGLEGFEKLVVLKRIRAEHAKNKRFIDMFLNEARLAARLHHPHVVQVYDIGLADNNYFFTMEYIHGENLRAIADARRGPLPLGHAIAIVSAAAAGLHCAHESRDSNGRPLGLIHRDVSPSNILVSYDGCVKVVDFGIAKAGLSSDTTTGELKGKIAYMSPEQCTSAAMDRRSDIFSLGIVLHELTTGQRLFGNETEFNIMSRIARGDIPRPSSRVRDYPPELERIVMKALAFERDARYATAQEMQRDLEALARDRKLDVSDVGLSSLMSELFGEQLEAWRDSRHAGLSLGAHMVRTASSGGEGEAARTQMTLEILESARELAVVETPTSYELPRRGKTRRRIAATVGIAGAIGIIALVALLARRGSDPSAPAPAPAIAATAATQLAPPPEPRQATYAPAAALTPTVAPARKTSRSTTKSGRATTKRSTTPRAWNPDNPGLPPSSR